MWAGKQHMSHCLAVCSVVKRIIILMSFFFSFRSMLYSNSPCIELLEGCINSKVSEIVCVQRLMESRPRAYDVHPHFWSQVIHVRAFITHPVFKNSALIQNHRIVWVGTLKAIQFIARGKFSNILLVKLDVLGSCKNVVVTYQIAFWKSW